jgi:lysophospholipase L1-like esterase
MRAEEKRRPAWSLAIGIVAAIALLSLALAKSSQPTSHLMTFAGDSIMQGGGATIVANTVVGRLTSLKPYWFIRNYSVAGASVSGADRFPAMDANNIVPLRGNPVVVFLGTNDWSFGIPIASFRANYSRFIHTLEQSGPQVICVTPVWRVDDGTLNKAGYKLDDYRKAITEICTADQHPVIDGSPLIPHDPGNYIDGIHPNDAGYAFYTQHLADALDKFVE